MAVGRFRRGSRYQMIREQYDDTRRFVLRQGAKIMIEAPPNNTCHSDILG